MFYDEYVKLCRNKGVSPTRAAADVGISASTVSDWKNKGRAPQARHLYKLAEYFGVSVAVLLDEKKDDPALSESEIDEEISSIFESLSDDQKAQAVAFLRFLAGGDTAAK